MCSGKAEQRQANVPLNFPGITRDDCGLNLSMTKSKTFTHTELLHRQEFRIWEADVFIRAVFEIDNLGAGYVVRFKGVVSHTIRYS